MVESAPRSAPQRSSRQSELADIQVHLRLMTGPDASDCSRPRKPAEFGGDAVRRTRRRDSGIRAGSSRSAARHRGSARAILARSGGADVHRSEEAPERGTINSVPIALSASGSGFPVEQGRRPRVPTETDGKARQRRSDRRWSSGLALAACGAGQSSVAGAPRSPPRAAPST